MQLHEAKIRNVQYILSLKADMKVFTFTDIKKIFFLSACLFNSMMIMNICSDHRMTVISMNLSQINSLTVTKSGHDEVTSRRLQAR